MAFPIIAAVGRLAVGSAIKGATTSGVSSVIGGARINVKTNLKAVEKAIDAFGKNQIPFAMANTLNDAAFQIRKNTIENVWGDNNIVRKSNFMSAMIMPIRGTNRATKKKLFAVVQNYPTGRRHKDYLQRAAIGGYKTVIDGRNIAIPGRESGLRNAKGAVPKSKRPRQLLNKKNVFKVTSRRSGQELIVERPPKMARPLKVLYVLEPIASIDNYFKFYEEADRLANKVMRENFRKNFARAKASARRFK